MKPSIARITIYPVKSCDGVVVAASDVLPGGGLRHDRQFALFDHTGRFINAKRTPLIHQLNLVVDPNQREFHVSRRGSTDVIHGQLDDDGRVLSDWLSNFFSLEVSIVENLETGFPDDLDASGPTVVSTATLETVAEWFPGLPVDEVRRRFRANLEIDGVEPFWEDRLFGSDSTPRPFRVGSVVLGGTNPCQRCVVPSRDSQTGATSSLPFAQQFGQLRERALPEWSARNRFDHFYRLSTNTRCLQRGDGIISKGDLIDLTVG